MGYRDIVDIADLAAAEPRGLVRAYPRQSELRLMTTDRVVCQCGAFGGKRYDLSKRYKTQLDESLEAVADTDHQTVTGVQHFLNSVLYPRVAEESIDELRRALRLVTAGESAGEHNHL